MIKLARIMPSAIQKRAQVFAGVSGAAACVGAIAGVGATMLTSAWLGGPLVHGGLLLAGATTGVAVALVSGPLLAFTMLRREPIGRSLVRSFVGAMIGGAIGLRIGVDAINPYLPFSLFRAPMWQAALGAISGAVLLALVARWQRMRQRTVADNNDRA